MIFQKILKYLSEMIKDFDIDDVKLQMAGKSRH